MQVIQLWLKVNLGWEKRICFELPSYVHVFVIAEYSEKEAQEMHS